MMETAMGEDDTAIEPAFVLELIALIYEAAMDSARWPAFLDAFERCYPGSGKALWYEHATDSAVSLLSTSGFDPVAMDEYARHYASLNPWTDVMQTKPSGFVNTGEMLVPKRELERSEFYCDFLRPRQLADGFGASIFNEGDRQMYFSVLLPPGQRCGAKELALTRELVPHLQRAMAIHRRFARLEARAEGAEALLDRLDIGAVLVGEDLRIALANRAAEALLNRADGLLVRAGALRAHDRRDDARLQAALRAALATAAGRRPDGGGRVAVARPSGKRPLSLLVSPLFPGDVAAASRLAEAEPQVAVRVSDPDAGQERAAARAAEAHELTAGEASLLDAFLSEGTLPRAAERLRITHETARSHLKRIFAKTGARSQAELVRIVLPAGLVRRRPR
jgi:DNA-binding CsgD family transcriptional regulator